MWWFFGGLVLGGGFVYFTIWSNSDHELLQFHFVLLLSENISIGFCKGDVEIFGVRFFQQLPPRYLTFSK